MHLLSCFFTNQYAKIVACILLFREIALQTKYDFSPYLGGGGGGEWRRIDYTRASYPGVFFLPSRVQPLYGAGRKDTSGTGPSLLSMFQFII